MAKRDIDYISIITDLKKAGRSNKEELIRVLYRYDIPKIESLERRVLDYVFSVTDDKLRFTLVDYLAEANNLPIIHECYYVIYSGLAKENYVKAQIMNLGKSRESLIVKYDLCRRIISQSATLQEFEQKIVEIRHTSHDYEGMKVVNHRFRNKKAKRD